MRADKAAIAHVDELAGDGGQTIAADHRKAALDRRAVARVKHGPRFIDRYKQQLIDVRHDDIAVQQITQLAAFNGAGAHSGHGCGGEAFKQKRQHVFVSRFGGVFCRAAGNIGQAARTGYQAHADFYQANVAFHGRHPLGRVHSHLATTAKGQAANGGDHGHSRITHFQHHVLQLCLDLINGINATHHEGRQHGLQVSANREHLVV